jgi:hypothetical protein
MIFVGIWFSFVWPALGGPKLVLGRLFPLMLAASCHHIRRSF